LEILESWMVNQPTTLITKTNQSSLWATKWDGSSLLKQPFEEMIWSLQGFGMMKG
jgi:hypothetical protein